MANMLIRLGLFFYFLGKRWVTPGPRLPHARASHPPPVRLCALNALAPSFRLSSYRRRARADNSLPAQQLTPLVHTQQKIEISILSIAIDEEIGIISIEVI